MFYSCFCPILALDDFLNLPMNLMNFLFVLSLQSAHLQFKEYQRPQNFALLISDKLLESSDQAPHYHVLKFYSLFDMQS